MVDRKDPSYYPPGVLNDNSKPFSDKLIFDITTESLDSAARKMAKQGLKRQFKASSSGVMYAVVLRVEGYQARGNFDGTKSAMGTITTGKQADADLVVVRAMIPFLHSHIPTPSRWGDEGGRLDMHQWLIGLYPAFVAKDESLPVAPCGSIIRVSFGNIENESDPAYEGVVSLAAYAGGTSTPKTAKESFDQGQGRTMEELKEDMKRAIACSTINKTITEETEMDEYDAGATPSGMSDVMVENLYWSQTDAAPDYPSDPKKATKLRKKQRAFLYKKCVARTKKDICADVSDVPGWGMGGYRGKNCSGQGMSEKGFLNIKCRCPVVFRMGAASYSSAGGIKKGINMPKHGEVRPVEDIRGIVLHDSAVAWAKTYKGRKTAKFIPRDQEDIFKVRPWEFVSGLHRTWNGLTGKGKGLSTHFIVTGPLLKGNAFTGFAGRGGVDRTEVQHVLDTDLVGFHGGWTNDTSIGIDLAHNPTSKGWSDSGEPYGVYIPDMWGGVSHLPSYGQLRRMYELVDALVEGHSYIKVLKTKGVKDGDWSYLFPFSMARPTKKDPDDPEGKRRIETDGPIKFRKGKLTPPPPEEEVMAARSKKGLGKTKPQFTEAQPIQVEGEDYKKKLAQWAARGKAVEEKIAAWNKVRATVHLPYNKVEGQRIIKARSGTRAFEGISAHSRWNHGDGIAQEYFILARYLGGYKYEEAYYALVGAFKPKHDLWLALPTKKNKTALVAHGKQMVRNTLAHFVKTDPKRYRSMIRFMPPSASRGIEADVISWENVVAQWRREQFSADPQIYHFAFVGRVGVPEARITALENKILNALKPPRGAPTQYRVFALCYNPNIAATNEFHDRYEKKILPSLLSSGVMNKEEDIFLTFSATPKGKSFNIKLTSKTSLPTGDSTVLSILSALETREVSLKSAEKFLKKFTKALTKLSAKMG